MTPSVFFGSVAIALCCYGGWRWWYVASLQRWKKVAGRVVKIEELEHFYTYVGIRVPYYVPRIEFSYEISGQEYRSRMFSVHNFTIGTKGEIADVLRGAKVGDTIQIFYDPKVPHRASISVPGYDGVIVSLFLGGGLLVLVLLLRVAV